ncbi:histidine kinase [Actinoplanes sp. NPDC026623]|uniref:sensor histidine kinase n=1 Tax=Actinoplanes sp. NPDC026623 TaxID=3155610 RepID=UPI0033E9FB7D
MVRQRARGIALLGLILIEVPLLALAAVALLQASGIGLIPLFPPAVLLVRRMAAQTRRHCTQWCGITIAEPYDPEPPHPEPTDDGWYRYRRTLFRSPRLPAWLARLGWMLRDPATWRDLAWLGLDPLVKLALAPGLLLAPARTLPAYGRWAALLLGPTTARRLAGEVQRLNTARVRAGDTQTAEMRRIERDLHDGIQGRLVALGMAAATAEKLVDSSPGAAKALLGQVRGGTAEALAELRRVVRGISPPVLTERGLADALRALALDSPLRVRVDVTLPGPLPAPVESAVYFAVSELLTNAAKYAGAGHAAVEIRHDGTALHVHVRDDGSGGADPARGTGLHGIERRLAAFDGTSTVTSPPGGPTSVTLTVPDRRSQRAGRVPRWETTLVVVCWSLAWLPLFTQGLGAAAAKLAGAEHSRWLLPLRASGIWQWPMIAGMVAAGIAMYLTAVWLPVRRPRGSPRSAT